MTDIQHGTKLQHIATGSEGVVIAGTQVIPDASIVKITHAEAGRHHKKGDSQIWEDHEVYVLGEGL